MSDENSTVALRKPADVALARKAALQAMEKIGASAIRRTKFVTAVSEIARNAVVHGGGGVMSFRIARVGEYQSVIAECRDRGPGIPDIKRAMQDGFTTGGGMGLGLGGARRLSDRFEIRSEAGKGTTVVMEAGPR